MNTKEAAPAKRPFTILRSNQIDHLLQDDQFLATEVEHLRIELSQYGIVLARRDSPPVSKVEDQRLRRKRHADAGFCMYSKKHGKATYGTRCTACYETNQKNVKERRAKAKQSKEQAAAEKKKDEAEGLTW